jgi:hypothetical protein
VIDRRGLEHRLALARHVISPAADAKARVLEGLSGAPVPSPVRVSVFTAPRVALLMGLSLALGYGLGLHAAMPDTARDAPPERAGGPQAPRSLAEPSLTAPPPTTPAPLAAPANTASPLATTTGEPASDASSPLVAPAPPNSAVRPTARTSGAARSGATSPSAAPPTDATRDATVRARDELALLQRVERALRAKEAALALALLDELERRHPRSMLLEERRAARVVAECLLPMASARRPAERTESEHTAAERFLTEHRASVYADRIRRACGL